MEVKSQTESYFDELNIKVPLCMSLYLYMYYYRLWTVHSGVYNEWLWDNEE